MAQYILSCKGHLMECLQTQATLIFQSCSPSLLNHPAKVLECWHHGWHPKVPTSMMELRIMNQNLFWTVRCSKGNLNIWWTGRDTGLKTMNEHQWRMSQVQGGSYLSSTAGTQRPHSIYLPWTLPISPSTQLPTSLILPLPSDWAASKFLCPEQVRVCTPSHHIAPF